MGLRLVAHFYDRVEALVACSAIDASGTPVFMESAALLTLDNGYLGALGGFRLVVCEQDLEAACATLTEARANPLREGESLEVEFDVLHGALSFAVGMIASAPAPIRSRRWS